MKKYKRGFVFILFWSCLTSDVLHNNILVSSSRIEDYFSLKKAATFLIFFAWHDKIDMTVTHHSNIQVMHYGPYKALDWQLSQQKYCLSQFSVVLFSFLKESAFKSLWKLYFWSSKVIFKERRLSIKLKNWRHFAVELSPSRFSCQKQFSRPFQAFSSLLQNPLLLFLFLLSRKKKNCTKLDLSCMPI